MAVFSISNDDPNDVAILATSANEAIRAHSTNNDVAAIAARNTSTADTSRGASVFAETSGNGPGIVAIAHGQGHGVHSRVTDALGAGYAIYAEHSGEGEFKRAAFFDGNVVVTGDVLFPGADCAEEFPILRDISNEAEPRTLMVIGSDSRLEIARRPYDHCVAGVVAGAGDLRPGIVMGRGLSGDTPARAIALVGRVWVKADAEHGPIDVGDLLTSSATPGHAMRASDRDRAFGTVIGKALAPLPSGRGLVPVLIALQ